MTLPDLIQALSGFNKIIVSGPQRSGTTLMCHIIMDELGYPEPFRPVAMLQKARGLLRNDGKVLIHGPSLCRWIDTFGDDVAIVFMRRNIDDILASQERIGWNKHEGKELARYEHVPGERAAEVKYRYFDENQKVNIKNLFEVWYESMSVHPMWVPKAMRVDFKSRQVA